jgi:beta-lactamase superfamily II metal-dependent hydrolase
MTDPITIRMYNVGFGDCFLIRFPTADGRRTLLLDCGVHFASQKPHSLTEVVKAVLEDVTDEQGVPHIDVVAMSHRHQDHVKGFEDPRWTSLQVREVWMPWTENPEDPIARGLLERQSASSLALTGLAAEGSEAYLLAMNSLTNEEAMATLHGGFAGAPLRRFLPERPKPDAEEQPADFPVLQTSALPGVTIRVLGPSFDEAVIRRMDPPELERYIKAPKESVAAGGNPLPFERWQISQETFAKSAAYQHLDTRGRGEVVNAGRIDSDRLAVAIDQTVNNTSLMLLIQFGRACLLFPGDSQWGTWDRVLQRDEGRRLLQQTTFYKVGHHGSHNATPRTFVESLLSDAIAMVSVAPTSIESWKNIPKAELLTELRAEGRCYVLVNSDELSQADEAVSILRDGLAAEVAVPA